MLVNSIFFSSSSLGKGHPDTLFSNKTDSKSTTRNRVRAAIPSPPQIKPESLNLLLSASHLDHVQTNHLYVLFFPPLTESSQVKWMANVAYRVTDS